MRLEDLPEIKEGMIAEIGFINPDDRRDFGYEASIQFRLFYIEGIRFLKRITPFNPDYSSYFEEVAKESADFTSLRTFHAKYRKKRGEIIITDCGNVNIEAIVSFKPLEYAQIERQK